MYFDIAMSITLLIVTLVAMLLNDKVENKLKKMVEEREFNTRDAVLLVAAMSVTISLVVFIPQMAIMFIFLFAYSMLLFTFTFVFSDLQKTKAKLFYIAFLIVSPLAFIGILLNFGGSDMLIYGALAFGGLFSFTVGALFYERHRKSLGERWYLAALPPALFILLYTFFSKTTIWFPYLLNLYGIIFAILIILYLGSLFTWKTTLIFVGLLTLMDIILVLFTGTMVSAAMHVSELRLPVLISIPTIPTIILEKGMIYMSLGLGDFFFAGLISIQTMKKFGKRFAIISLTAMAISFFVYETLMLNYELRALPGTLMIICGWLPLILYKILSTKIRGKML